MSKLSDWLTQIESRHPTEIDLGLERVDLVAHQAKIKKFSQPVVTVAGTNGKGSTIAAMETLLIQMGYSVGVYTSPHLVRYNERVRINGKPVADSILVESFDEIEEHRLAAGEPSLTYFETGTLSALWIFRQEKPDVVLLEVGLGGRLDAVNIVDADIAVVTGIAKDHEDWLGSDLNQIGQEKAGIFRQGQTVVIGQSESDGLPESVIDRAKALGCDIYLAGKQFGHLHDRMVSEEQQPLSFFWEQENGFSQSLHISGKGCGYISPQDRLSMLPLPSWASALQVLQLLLEKWVDRKEPLTNDIAKEIVLAAQLPGRFSTHESFPQTIFDVAHNPQAATLLAERIQAIGSDRCVLVIGMLRDKDIAGVLQQLKSVKCPWVVADLSHLPRGLSAQELAEQIEQNTYQIPSIAADPVAAWRKAREIADADTQIIVFGSFFTVGEILATSGFHLG